MAATNHISHHKAPAFTAPAAFFQAARERLAEYRRYRQTVNELSALSDRELADLGLHRSAIRGVAREVAKGKG